jgi:hypothetical protein
MILRGLILVCLLQCSLFLKAVIPARGRASVDLLYVISFWLGVSAMIGKQKAQSRNLGGGMNKLWVNPRVAIFISHGV